MIQFRDIPMSLSWPERWALSLRSGLGSLSLRQAAGVMGCSHTQVRRLAIRAKGKLQEAGLELQELIQYEPELHTTEYLDNLAPNQIRAQW